ncbi:hypothetical protein NDO58_11190 [Klebsiella sp. ZYC-1]|uniref:hypothetical protein n=1 Tax=Klebsiella sp. ZYC-1 TaxID=2951084 RepID=UPI002575C2D5|nr:hypothetical protein [Klebsiella sp. ZYC-1]WJI35023.1 hypothetical protein NDO58_11190 [Klebsiella sp. ZYC-1]
MTNNNQFIMVPMELLKIKKVNGITFNDGLKTLYCYLKGWDGNAFPSYSKMAEVFGVTSRAMEERIKILVKMNLINKVNRVYTSNYYEVLDFPHINPPESIHASPVEDVKTIPDAIPQTKSEEPAQSDTEALSDDVEECPFFTTSEEAFKNESEDESGVFSLPYAGSSKKKEVDLDAICNTLINCLDAGNRKSDEKFTPFAKRILEDLGITFPAGLEIYFSKTYHGIYEDLDTPF